MNPTDYDKILFEAQKQQLNDIKKFYKNSYNISQELMNQKTMLKKENEKLKKKYLKK